MFYFTVCFSESTFMLKVVSLGGMTRDRDFSGCSGRGFGSLKERKKRNQQQFVG